VHVQGRVTLQGSVGSTVLQEEMLCFCEEHGRTEPHLRSLLAGTDDCLDRIVVNAYSRMGHDAGGFRVRWRKLTGSEDTLDNAHLVRMAGRFSRRLRAWAAEEGIPV